MKPLTSKQIDVLTYIRKSQKEQGAPPSLREIASALGFKSLNTVQQHLRLISQKGYIHLNPGKARGIDICADFETKKDIGTLQVPLIGTVAAGKPITALENITDYLTLDHGLFHDQDLFALRVKGESMLGIGVLDGDYVVVRPQSHAGSGEIVVVIIENEATLKRYIVENKKILLRAENPAYADIILSETERVWIAGKMVGLIRKY